MVVAGVSVSTRGGRISSSLIVRKETYAIKGSDILALRHAIVQWPYLPEFSKKNLD